MVPLTTRQRDLLEYLLTAKLPVVVAEIARHTELTPRQVAYNLKNIKLWLTQHKVDLITTTGIGIELSCTAEQQAQLLNKLEEQSSFQLVLTAAERQQLIVLKLLTATQPLILYQLQQDTQISRTTLLKDLDIVEAWADLFRLVLQRRPNFGFLLQGTEFNLRQALAALLWGDGTLGTPLMEIDHTDGLIFSLAGDAALLPIVKQIDDLSHKWPIQRAQSWVTYAENQLGGRFTDEAFLYLMLVLAIQAQRAQTNYIVEHSVDTLRYLQQQTVWGVAERIYKHMWLNIPESKKVHEVAAVAMHLLAGARVELFNSDMVPENQISQLLETLMAKIAEAFQIADFLHDDALQQGLATQIIPACMRQRFGLWSPPTKQEAVLSDEYALEHALAHDLAQTIATHTQTILPAEETNNLALLLRAAYIRKRPNTVNKVIVVCPSGMATSQLLVARIKARFPRIGDIEVLSLRKLNKDQIAEGQLIISTVPLANLANKAYVILVHPLLQPEDVEKIRRYLS